MAKTRSIRVFTPQSSFTPTSCQHLSTPLIVGNKYKILTPSNRTEPGIWILIQIGKSRYDVYLTDQEILLGTIEQIVLSRKSKR